MSEVLKIDGVAVNRTTAELTVTSLTPHVRGGVPSFRFARRGIALDTPPDTVAAKSVEYTLDGTLLFKGDVASYFDHFDDRLGWVREYTCLGLLNRANYVPVTDSLTSTDTARYNVAADDPDAVPARQGRTVGQIVEDVLTMTDNATLLDGYGVGAYTTLTPPTLPADTLADLAALTIIPPSEVDVSGERILQALEGVVQNYHPNHYVHVQPDGVIRFLDPRTFSATTLAIGTDPRVGLPELSRDWSGCYSRVVVRGFTQVQMANVRLTPWPGSSNPDGGLQEDFAHDGLTNAQAKDAWVATDFLPGGISQGQAQAGVPVLSGGAVSAVPFSSGGYGYTPSSTASCTVTGGGGTGAVVTLTVDSSGHGTRFNVVSGGSGYTSPPFVLAAPPFRSGWDEGTCTCPSTTTVTVTSANHLAHWGVDAWDQTGSGAHGVITLYAELVAGVTQFFTARVVANTAMTPGGSSTFTIDEPLPNLSYTAYQVTGINSGNSVVWRRYKLSDAAQGAALVNYFPYARPIKSPDGLAATMTTTPVAMVIKSATGNGGPPWLYRPMWLKVDPSTGTILLDRPSALTYSPDGTTAVPPDDVEAFLAVQTGTLSAVWPASGYAGTSYSVEGIERTKYITVNDWRDPGSSAYMETYATEMHGALSDTVVEGSLPYYGKLASALAPGVAYNVSAPDWAAPTGLETAALPCVQADLHFHETDGEPTGYTTVVHLSNRRAPYSAAAYVRPAQTGATAFSTMAGGLDLTGGLGGAQQALGQSLGALAGQVGETLEGASQAKAAAAAGGAGDVLGGAIDDAASLGRFDPSSIPQSTSDLGIPQSTAELGIPQSTADLGIPQTLEDLGIDLTGGAG